MLIPYIRPTRNKHDSGYNKIEYNYYSSYSHPCSGRVKEINEVAKKKRQSIDLIQSHDRRLCEMRRLQTELAYANIVYTPYKNSQLQGEVWTRKTL